MRRRFPAQAEGSALLHSPLHMTGLGVPMGCVQQDLVLGQKRDARMTTNEMSVIQRGRWMRGQRN